MSASAPAQRTKDFKVEDRIKEREDTKERKVRSKD